MAMTLRARSARGRRTLTIVAIAAVLLVPLVAMRFTDAVRWTNFDFVAAAVLLGGAAIGCELMARWFQGASRVVAITAVLAIVAAVWVQGAVGIV